MASQSTETATTLPKCTTVSTETQTEFSCPVINTVLSFIKYGLDSSCVSSLHKVTSSTFVTDEIHVARNLLYEECRLGKPQNKVNSSTRSRLSAMVSDIIEKMERLGPDLPDFFLQPVGLTRLKKIGVEDISEVAMADQIRRLQIQMTRVQDDLLNHTDDIIDMRNTRYTETQRSAHPHERPKTASIKLQPNNITSLASTTMPISMDGLFSSSAPPPSLSGLSPKCLSVQQTMVSNESETQSRVQAPLSPSAPSLHATPPAHRVPLSPSAPLSHVVPSDQSELPSVSSAHSLDSSHSPVSLPSGTSSHNTRSHNRSHTHTLPKTPLNPSAPKLPTCDFPPLLSPPGHYTSLASMFSGPKSDNRPWFQEKPKTPRPKENVKPREHQQAARSIRGKATNCSMQSSTEAVWEACITGVGPDVSIECMSQYLTANDIEFTSVTYVHQRTHSSAFKIVYPRIHYKKLFNIELWGPTVTVARFFGPRP